MIWWWFFVSKIALECSLMRWLPDFLFLPRFEEKLLALINWINQLHGSPDTQLFPSYLTNFKLETDSIVSRAFLKVSFSAFSVRSESSYGIRYFEFSFHWSHFLMFNWKTPKPILSWYPGHSLCRQYSSAISLVIGKSPSSTGSSSVGYEHSQMLHLFLIYNKS